MYLKNCTIKFVHQCCPLIGLQPNLIISYFKLNKRTFFEVVRIPPTSEIKKVDEGGGGELDGWVGGSWMGGGSPCRMPIIRNGNVALSILRKCRVALSILRKYYVACRMSHVAKA